VRQVAVDQHCNHWCAPIKGEGGECMEEQLGVGQSTVTTEGLD
jgi:hypothetical protein